MEVRLWRNSLSVRKRLEAMKALCVRMDCVKDKSTVNVEAAESGPDEDIAQSETAITDAEQVCANVLDIMRLHFSNGASAGDSRLQSFARAELHGQDLMDCRAGMR